jgi:hypothetical protein
LHNPKGAPKPHAIEPIEPTLDSEMVAKPGGAAIIDLGANNDWVSLRGREAIRRFLGEARERGYVDREVSIDFAK